MNGLAEAPSPPVTGPQFDNRRLAAALVDVLLLVPVALAIKTLCGGWGLTPALLTTGWALYYYFAFESGTGQTIGKRLLGLRVVRKDGGAPTMGEIAVRNVLRLVDGMFAYIVGLAVMLATGERRQRLGDIAAGTVVTAVSAAPPAASLAEEEDVVALNDAPDPTTPLPGLEPYTGDDLPETEPYPPAAEAPEQEITLPVFDDMPPAPAVEEEPEEPADELPPIDMAVPPPALEPEPELPAIEQVDELPPIEAAVPPPALDPAYDLPPIEYAVPPPAADPVVEPAPSPFADEPVPVAEPEEEEPEEDPAPRIDLPPPASAIDLLMEEQAADEGTQEPR